MPPIYAVFVKIKELAVAKSNTPGPKLNLPLKEICDIRFSSRDMKSASCSAEFTRCSTDVYKRQVSSCYIYFINC